MVLKDMSKMINDLRKSLYRLYGIWALFSARAFSTVKCMTVYDEIQDTYPWIIPDF